MVCSNVRQCATERMLMRFETREEVMKNENAPEHLNTIDVALQRGMRTEGKNPGFGKKLQITEKAGTRDQGMRC